jgi:large-conductance mechanosensitive channel
MADERISEVETKLYTHEGRIKSSEQDIQQVVGNIDRIEEHILRGSQKSVNWMQVISAVVGFLGVVGTAVFGIMNYVDLQLDHVKDSRVVYEERVKENSESLKDLNSKLHDRLGRLEERSMSHEGDIQELKDEIQ